MRYAFTAVVVPEHGYIIGMATEGTRGYTPVSNEGVFSSYDEATARAKKMNEQAGLSEKEAFDIVIRTMAKA